jgi:3-oxoacyl-[acyl-carrier-protein] synthase-3
VSERRIVRYAHIAGWGKYVPSKVVTNQDLARTVDTSDEWIITRTGIHERRIVASTKETTATMSIAASKDALEMAGLAPEQLDLIIVATATPEYSFPATACVVQDALGAENAGAFDLSAGCSGFMYGLAMGAQAIASGVHSRVLVIGAETLSRIVNWHDRETCVLFGDGAGAVVLEGGEQPGGVLSTLVRSDGSGGELLMLPAGGSRQPPTMDTVAMGLHYIKMNGREVFKFATRVMDKAARQVVADAGLTMQDVDIVIPHQANMRIIQAAARALEMPIDKFYINLDKYGNTSAASIPIAMCEAVDAGRIKPGDHVVMVGFGAGLTWAAAVIQWGVPKPPVPAWRRTLEGLRYVLAGIRSRTRRLRRRVEAVLFGSPEPTTIDGNRQRETRGTGQQAYEADKPSETRKPDKQRESKAESKLPETEHTRAETSEASAPREPEALEAGHNSETRTVDQE